MGEGGQWRFWGLVIEKREVAHSPRGQGDERLTEGGVVYPVIDNQPGPVLLVFARRHRFELHEVIVEPRAAAKAQGIGHLKQGARLLQQRLGPLQSQHLQIAFGRHSGPAAEQPLEVKGT